MKVQIWPFLKSKLISQTLLIFFFYALMELTNWIPLRFWKIWGGGNFIDSYLVLNYGDCYKNMGLAIYEYGSGFCHQYLYGRSLVEFLSFAKIHSHFTTLFGFGFMLLFSLALAYMFPWRNRKKFGLSLIILLSPPVLLLVERGNFDVFMFGGIAAASFLMSRGKWTLAATIVFVLTLTKFYTAPLLIIIAIISPKLIQKIFSFSLFCISIPLILRDVKITQHGYPHGSGAQFGMKVWNEYIQEWLPNHFTTKFGVVVSLSVFALFIIASALMRNYYIFRIVELPKFGSRMDFIDILKILSAVTFLSCFLAGMNFDYRLLFILPLISFRDKDLNSQLVNPFLIISWLILWLSFPSGGLQIIGDLIIEFLGAIISVRLVQDFAPHLYGRIRSLRRRASVQT